MNRCRGFLLGLSFVTCSLAVSAPELQLLRSTGAKVGDAIEMTKIVCGEMKLEADYGDYKIVVNFLADPDHGGAVTLENTKRKLLWTMANNDAPTPKCTMTMEAETLGTTLKLRCDNLKHKEGGTQHFEATMPPACSK